MLLKRTTDAVRPDLVWQAFPGDHHKAQLLEEDLFAGQGKKPLKGQSSAFLDGSTYQLSTDTPATARFFNCKALDLGQIPPYQLDCHTPPNLIAVALLLDPDQEVAQVLVEIGVGTEEHPIQLGVIGDQPVNVRHIVHGCVADQSWLPYGGCQTP